MSRTTKSAKASTSAAEKVQDESSTHKQPSSSDQEQDPEVFIQPSQPQILPIYVSCSLSTDELMLDTIWEKIEEFCKPQ